MKTVDHQNPDVANMTRRNPALHDCRGQFPLESVATYLNPPI